MKAIGRGSLAVGLRVFLDVLRVVLFAGLGLAAVLAAISIYAYATGPAESVFGIPLEMSDPWYVTAVGFVVSIGTLVAALIVVVRLRRIFATLSAGDPFVPENARHLRVIAVVIAIFEASRLVLTGVAATLIDNQAIDEGTRMSVEMELNLLVWFGVLSLIVLAEVFREGARLRQDQQLTI